MVFWIVGIIREDATGETDERRCCDRRKAEPVPAKLRERWRDRPESAKSLDQLGCRSSFVFQRLVSQGVFVEVPGGRYYMDVGRAEVFRARRRLVLLATAGLVLAAVLILLALR